MLNRHKLKGTKFDINNLGEKASNKKSSRRIRVSYLPRSFTPLE